MKLIKLREYVCNNFNSYAEFARLNNLTPQNLHKMMSVDFYVSDGYFFLRRNKIKTESTPDINYLGTLKRK